MVPKKVSPLHSRVLAAARAASRPVALVVCTSAAALPSHMLAQASPGQTYSSALVQQFTNATLGYGTVAPTPCSQTAPFSAGPTAASCPSVAAWGTTALSGGSANPSARTVSGTATVTVTSGLQSGQEVKAQGAGWAVSQLTVNGATPSNGQLVFHFTTSQGASALGGAATGPANDGSALWSLRVFGNLPTPVSGTTAFASSIFQKANANGTGSLTGLGPGAHQTSSGFDVFLPLTSGSYAFNFVSDEFATAVGQPPGAIFSAFLDATLSGIDAVTSAGAVIGSATFSSSNGFATLDLQNGGGTTTAPEPSSFALLGSGLVGLAPIARRKRRA